MELLSQFLIILAFSLGGEALQRLLPLPIPASVYGIVLLFAGLCGKLVRVDQVKRGGQALVALLPLLFVSPAVGILDCWDALRGAVLPVLLLIFATTVLTFGIAGRIAQAAQKGGHEPGDHSVH